MRRKKEEKAEGGKVASIQTPPKWYGNTYFWWAAAIFVLTIGGLIRGPGVITDPGQKPENNLIFVYFGAGVIMLVNGLMSHSQAMAAFQAHQAQSNEDL